MNPHEPGHTHLEGPTEELVSLEDQGPDKAGELLAKIEALPEGKLPLALFRRLRTSQEIIFGKDGSTGSFVASPAHPTGRLSLSLHRIASQWVDDKAHYRVELVAHQVGINDLTDGRVRSYRPILTLSIGPAWADPNGAQRTPLRIAMDLSDRHSPSSRWVMDTFMLALRDLEDPALP